MIKFISGLICGVLVVVLVYPAIYYDELMGSPREMLNQQEQALILYVGYAPNSTMTRFSGATDKARRHHIIYNYNLKGDYEKVVKSLKDRFLP